MLMGGPGGPPIGFRNPGMLLPAYAGLFSQCGRYRTGTIVNEARRPLEEQGRPGA